MGKLNNVKYFLRGEKESIIWDPDTNAVAAQCSAAGVFATTQKVIEDLLTKRGYKPVDADTLAELGLAAPEPDRTDHTAKEPGGKYIRF